MADAGCCLRKASLEGFGVGSLATLHHQAGGWRNREQIVSYSRYKAGPCSVPKSLRDEAVYLTHLN